MITSLPEELSGLSGVVSGGLSIIGVTLVLSKALLCLCAAVFLGSLFLLFLTGLGL